MDKVIPLPTISQVRQEGPAFFLGHKRIGTVDYSDGYLTKLVKGDLHTFRRRPGIAWNMELLAIAERHSCQGLRIILTTPEGDREYKVPWYVVERYAQAAVDGDRRYLLKWDEDDQVLIPWAAWKGEELGPPEKKVKVKVPENQEKLL